MKTRAGRDRARSSGFTLLELLVVMSLMSLLALGMASALQTTSQATERVDVALTRADDLQISSEFLRSILGRVSLQRRVQPYAEGLNQHYFEGTDSQITWLGIMPAGYGAGGLSIMRLRQAASEDGIPSLLFQYLPWNGGVADADWAGATSHVLLRGIARLELSYEDARSEPPTWSPAWGLKDHVPQRVGLEIHTLRGALPIIVVPMRPLPVSDPRSRGPVFGGSVQ